MNIEELHAYLDGELSPEDAARVEAAAESDAALAAELAALRDVDRALDGLPGLDAPADFTDRVVRAVKRRRRGLLLRIALPAAAAAALVLAVILPGKDIGNGDNAIFTTEEHMEYVWEADSSTFGSGALSELEEAIVAELESA